MIPVCFSATLCRPVKVTAMTDIPQVEQGETFSIGAGIGSYNGHQASAIGVSGRITEGLIFKAGVGSFENGHAAFGGGVSYSW
ncbi:YadA C-terminal domain-containing protein [Oxalobacter aliiformigenes]|uniref:YadA C-terminal domain-containing protein n=1 Tax=Oxalobacter aliiformigenes TaxID=2946593 RepID=UPI0022AEE51C|nr:YadA C-terminal domain-containing protein [Oxalobacter aliiformigenes]MCZ4064065.1 YadA C-terminal domain-containing protein [Oxalobacter aliiformigenes]WAV99442.1 YadA C-terminal domain-containing protein [Oxalobacter aliiformigenes]